MAVDQIHSHANARTDICLNAVKKNIRKNANELFQKESIDLMKLVEEQNHLTEKELNWLLI